MSDTNLKPCPFCKEVHDICNIKSLVTGDEKLFVSIDCVGGDYDGNAVIGIEEYNSRPIEDEQAKLIEKLGEALILLDLPLDYDILTKNERFVETALKEYKEWKDKHAT